MSQEVVYALLLTLMAGGATGIGSAIAFFAKRTNSRFLSFSLGLSAGVMIYVSFVELLYEARINLIEIIGDPQEGTLYTTIAFFAGILIAGGIDKLIPEVENPHELHSVEEINSPTPNHHNTNSLKKAGIVTAIAIAIHNFPEGIATFMSGIESAQVGIAIAVAVAIHNIPEGIAVSVPIFYASGSKKKAFWLSLLSGLAEPVGAIVAYFILLPFITPVLLQSIFAAVAGIMVYISLDELLPAAHQYGESHSAVYGIITGMAIMALSLLMLM